MKILKRTKLIFALPLIATIFFFQLHVQAQTPLYIKIGEAQLKKSLLAIPAFQFSGNPMATKNYQSIGVQLYQTLQNDLAITNYFQLISPDAFLEDTSKTTLLPAPGDPKGFKFESWGKIGADFLIRGAFSIIGNEVTFETYTYHVPKSTLILGKKYKGSITAAKRIAHTFANDLLKAMTGVEGMFLSKITMTCDRSGGQTREVFVMDWDGSSIQQISNHKAISLSPAWSPNGKYIAYTAFVKHLRSGKTNSDLFVYELATGTRWLVSFKPGMNSGAAYTPDGKYIYLTLSHDGNSDIFKINTEGKVVQKLTSGPSDAANVEPAVSPDGRQIAFSSERSGNAMIYVMNSDGGNIRRVTFAGKLNNSPAWSPDGKQIAFAGMDDGHFDLFIMNADGSKLQRLTASRKPNGKAANNEHPSFSPDGRFILFTSDRSGSNQIYIISPDGSNERRVTQDSYNYYKPKWSINLD